ncbi:MAG: putative glycoside hydrolase [Patescibacteria group bacterium]
MIKVILTVVIIAGIGGGMLFDYFRAPNFLSASSSIEGAPKEKTVEERVADAKRKSENIRGVYMTYVVAVDRGVAATRLRESIKHLIETTEVNGVVIDVKENQGMTISENLKKTVQEFHNVGAWVIARMTIFRDNSQVKEHPEYYTTRGDGRIWGDNHNNYWMDAAGVPVWKYQVGEMERAIDVGFDEIQMDYVRFPSDGNMKDIAYPYYDSKKQKSESIKNFLAYVNRELKRYKPEIIISADLFGYVSTNPEDLGIGQRLVDIGDSVDYISFMLYPSHYYGGFQVPADTERNLPALYYPYKNPDPLQVVSSKPFDVVFRSILIALDVMGGKNLASTTQKIKNNQATTTTEAGATATPAIAISRAKIRPWLQDFDLGVDKNRGIYYDSAKVRAQIHAAENAGASGWLLWSPGNTYTVEALQKKN